MPTLRELRGSFLKLLKQDGSLMRRDVPFAEADGVIFLCPKCFVTNKGSRGTHSVICWFVGRVPDAVDPKPGRWNPSGTGLDDLTFIGPGAASVLLTGEGCKWHGFVKDGVAK